MEYLFSLTRLAREISHLHPALVHFPIGLVLTGMAIETWTILRGGSPSRLARVFLWFGLAGAVAAVISGVLLFHPEDFRGRTQEVAYIHRVLGLGSLGFILLTAGLGGWVGGSPPRGTRGWLYRVSYGTTAAVVGLAGHYGGWLMFGWGPVWTF